MKKENKFKKIIDYTRKMLEEEDDLQPNSNNDINYIREDIELNKKPYLEPIIREIIKSDGYTLRVEKISCYNDFKEIHAIMRMEQPLFILNITTIKRNIEETKRFLEKIKSIGEIFDYKIVGFDLNLVMIIPKGMKMKLIKNESHD